MDTSVQKMIETFGITQDAKDFLASEPRMVVDGKFVDSSSGARFDVLEPATGGKLSTIPAGTTDDVDAAVEAVPSAARQLGRAGRGLVQAALGRRGRPGATRGAGQRRMCR
jgi:hypothetical protein